ncbi:MAG: SdpI family protein [Clostridia bacterium]|nr:SdpI family protein [Clostridia bacterium]
MRGKLITIAALAVLTLAIAAVFLSFLPDEIPVHYNSEGQIDRIGSKYEYLIFPGSSAVMGLIMFAIIRRLSVRSMPREANVVAITGISVLIVINILTLYFLYEASRFPSGADGGIGVAGIGKVCSIGVGILLLITGNIMPKATRNALFGLRTKWSMANDRVWLKSQRFAGGTAIICGLLLVLLAVFVPSIAMLYVMIGLIAVWTVICIVASYLYYKREK